jgi:hypothetical protein
MQSYQQENKTRVNQSYTVTDTTWRVNQSYTYRYRHYMTGESVLHIPLQTLHDEVINVDKTRVNQSYTYRYWFYMTRL